VRSAGSYKLLTAFHKCLATENLRLGENKVWKELGKRKKANKWRRQQTEESKVGNAIRRRAT